MTDELLPPAPEGTYAHNPQHVEEAVSHLIDFFKRPRNEAVVDALAGEVQEVEDAIWDINTSFDIETATGNQLDLLGKLIGEYRDEPGFEDRYRRHILGRGLVNVSHGRMEELLAIISVLLDDPSVNAQEMYPAGIQFDIDSPFVLTAASKVASMVKQASPAGVGIGVVQVFAAEGMRWGTPGIDLDHGWGTNWAGVL